ncbi:MAG TPA: DUF6365 family protein [Streptosporangiaceae bacterium]|nr:DUF6365 family protein [Streptosporangiaceae bacterium]
MKLLFISPSPHSSGQLLLGCSLAAELRRIGVQSHFIASDGAEQILRGYGFPHMLISPQMGMLAKLLIDDFVRTVRPDAIVLAEYLNYTHVMSAHFRLNPWFIESYGVPVIPIDLWELERTGFAADLCGGRALAISPHIKDMDCYLSPVPMARPVPDSRSAIPFRVTDPADPDGPVDSREHTRRELGLGSGDRLVMLAMSPWQLPDTGAPGRRRAASRVPELLAHYLRQLPADVRFLLAGAAPEWSRLLPAERTLPLPPCSPSRFGAMLRAADLMLSLNLSAFTMVRAVLSGTPVMLITNQFSVTEPGQAGDIADQLGGMSDFTRRWLARSVPLHPFRIWPMGFHGFLDSLLAGNPYLSAFSVAELLDEPGVLGGLRGLLFDCEERDRSRRRRADYLKEIETVPDSCTAFRQAMSMTGVSGA